MPQRGSILFIDAYDSFAENIAALLQQELNVAVTLIRIDCDVKTQFGQDNQRFFSSFDAIVLGPGPGDPRTDSDVGIFNQAWEIAACEKIPVLGICLGFQSLCVQYEVPIVRLDLPCHGHAKQIQHCDQDIFENAGDILATNYNSLGVRMGDLRQNHDSSRRNSSCSISSLSSSQSMPSNPSLPSRPSSRRPHRRLSNDLMVLAWDKEDWLMAIKHRVHPFHGFQFHPESCKSNSACGTLIRRWWRSAKAHNDLFRPLFTQRDPGSDGSRGPRAVDGNGDTAKIIEARLAGISHLCGPDIVCAKVAVLNGSARIAELCYESSQSDSVLMLESTRKGRFSIYAFPDDTTFRIEYANNHLKLTQGSVIAENVPLERSKVVQVLQNFMCTKACNVENPDIPFRGGLAGFLSYEFGTDSLGSHVTNTRTSATSVPDISLAWINRSVVFDHHQGLAYIQSIRRNDGKWVQDIAVKIGELDRLGSMTLEHADFQKLQEIQRSTSLSLPDHDKYISQIRKCQSELHAGNSYELCLTTEAEVFTPIGPDHSWLLYKNIQRHNPVPFAAFIRLEKITILSSSPEQFLSWTPNRTIDMVPMKGTVKKTPNMTLEKATAILASAKESAENLMIADLIRHDLYSTVGRDAVVEVVKLCDVIETETVFTLVSHIRAHVPPTVEHHHNPLQVRRDMIKYGIEALTHTLPPGSMTGAPKKRSCEILNHLEQRNRGVYSGAMGYMDVGGNGAWSVCIRTAFATDDDIAVENGRRTQKWRIGAGGAITVLSDEEQEWEEMMTKLDSVTKAFQHEG